MDIIKRLAEAVAQAFINPSEPYGAPDLINAGVNPYYAWMHVCGVDVKTLASEMGLKERCDVGAWPVSLPRLTPERMIDLIIYGHEKPDVPFILKFCAVCRITPDMLLPRERELDDPQYYAMPAPAEIVEAGVQYMIENREMGLLPDSLVDFLGTEVHKANVLASRALTPFAMGNAGYMQLAEKTYEAAIAKNPALMFDETDDGEEDASPVDDIRNSMDEVFALHEKNTEDGLRINHRAIAVEKARTQDALGKLYACVNAMAAMNQSKEWLERFNKAMTGQGLETTLKKLSADPYALVPMRPYWPGAASVKLPDGDFVAGNNIIEAFGDAYRAFQKHKPLLTRLEEEGNRDLNALVEFKEWRRAPQTAMYLKAEANRRHIIGNLEREELGMAPLPAAPLLLPPPNQQPRPRV